MRDSFNFFCFLGFSRNKKRSNFIILKFELGVEIYSYFDLVF